MRPAFPCSLVQTSAAEPYRQAPHDAPGPALAPAATPDGETCHATRAASR